LSSLIEWDSLEVTIFVMSLASDKEGTVSGRVVDLRPQITDHRPQVLKTGHKSFIAQDGLYRNLCIDENAQ
jgi:hypothetical protein